MSPWLSIPVGFAPSFVWLWIVHRRDDHEREPEQLVLLAMLLGGLGALAVLWVRPHIETWLQPDLLVDAFVVTALGEELWKVLAFLPLLRHRELDEPLDGVVYGAAVALGFAGVENALYATWHESLGVVVQRAFTSTLLHAGCTACIGYALAGWKLDRRAHRSWRRPLLRLLLAAIAVLLHGAYDWFLLVEQPSVVGALLVVLPVVLALAAAVARWARSVSHEYHPPQAPS